MTAAPALLVWLDPEQVDFVRAVAERAGMRVATVGASMGGETSAIAAALGAEPAPDLRAAIDVHGSAVDALWLASAAALERDEVEALERFAGPVLSAEPRPLRATALEEYAALARRLRVGPTLLDEPAWDRLLEMRADLGAIEVAFVRSEGPRAEGTLLSRTHDAMQAGMALLGAPDRVSATWHGATPTPDRLSAAERPARLVAHARVELGTLVVEAALGASRARRVELVGAGGRLVWDGCAATLRGPDGDVLDRTDAPLADPESACARVLRALTEPTPAPPRPDAVAVLAACEAARLATLTGDAERVEHVLRMVKA